MPRQPYPQAEEMTNEAPMQKEAPAAAPEGGEGGAPNPVIEAFQTIAAFVASLKEKQDPKAVQVEAAFKALLEALGAGGAAPGGEQPPEAMPPQQPKMEKANKMSPVM